VQLHSARVVVDEQVRPPVVAADVVLRGPAVTGF
jgi:hypothetical protein